MLAPTISYLRYYAVHRPTATAVISGGQEISYQQFDRDIRKMVYGLRDLELDTGASIGVQHPRFYLHFLILLAAEYLGILSFSYRVGNLEELEPFLATLDMVLYADGNKPESPKRLHCLSQEWVESVLAKDSGPALAAAYATPQTPARILHSSGTTGIPKLMTLTRQNHEVWVRQYEFRTNFGYQSRYLATMGFWVQAFYAYATACVRKGGVCVCDLNETIAEALAKYSITHFTCVPHTLIQVLDGLPGTYRKSADLTIFTIGAPVSETVRDRVRRLLASDIVESYGTSEVAAICTMRSDGTGTILPGVRVEVVDDQDKQVMHAPGRIRVETDASVNRYLNDPEASRRMFRDGWFYPGDVAEMIDANTIKLVGRVDELLNIRGVKIAPQYLEENLVRALPVNDVCLTTLQDEKGVSRLWVIVEPLQEGNLEILRGIINSVLPPIVGGFVLTSVDAIPRTVTGKIQRKELKRALIDSRLGK